MENEWKIKVVVPIGFFNRVECFFRGAGFFGNLETRALCLLATEVRKIGANVCVINSVGYGSESFDEYASLCEINASGYKSSNKIFFQPLSKSANADLSFDEFNPLLNFINLVR